MKLFVYATYDKKACVYSRPMFAPNDQSMLRSFSDVAQDKSHPIGKHPEDYTLWRLGTYDEEKGSFFQSKEDIKQVSSAIELVRPLE